MVRYYFWGVLAFFFRREVLKMIDWLASHLLEVLAAILCIAGLILLARWVVIRLRGSSPKEVTAVSYSD